MEKINLESNSYRNEIAANDKWWSGLGNATCDGFENSFGRDAAVAVNLTQGERVRIRVVARGAGGLL